MLDLVGNPEDRFSHNEAHIVIYFYDYQLYHILTVGASDVSGFIFDNKYIDKNIKNACYFGAFLAENAYTHFKTTFWHRLFEITTSLVIVRFVKILSIL